jgi:ethanolamine utilization protein EutN
MYIGLVSGNVVATIKHEAFHGRKLLLVDRLDLDGHPTGEYDICVDVVQAGVGDRVLVIDEGNGARQILRRDPAPVRAVIVGIVDQVEIAVETDGSGTGAEPATDLRAGSEENPA